MGCWNETCALSGLPIQGGDSCYRLQFDDVNQIAYRCVQNLNDCFSNLKSVKLGTYDEYGGLREYSGVCDYQEPSGGTVFILEHFWKHACLQDDIVQKYVQKEWDKILKQTERHKILVNELESKNISLDKLEPFQIPAYNIYQQDPNIYRELFFVFLIMPGLRRVFYTASHRGAQSTDHSWKTQMEMSKAIQTYIEQKQESGRIDIENATYW